MLKTISIILVLTVLLYPTTGKSHDSTIPYYIAEASRAFQIPAEILMGLCQIESNCRPNAINRFDSIPDENGKRTHSPSYGLFQIKLGTARMLGYTGTGKGLLDPEVNAFYAAKLLRKNWDKYRRIDKAISAHNAGKYTRFNKEYVNRVLASYVHATLDEERK